MDIKIKAGDSTKIVRLKDNELDENTGFDNLQVKLSAMKKFKSLIKEELVLYFKKDDECETVEDQVDWSCFIEENTDKDLEILVFLTQKDYDDYYKKPKKDKTKKKKKTVQESDPESEEEEEKKEESISKKKTKKKEKEPEPESESDKEPKNKKKAKAKLQTHKGYECLNCEMNPIKGARYQCVKCPNFNLCSQCEQQKGHGHVMIRFFKESEFKNPIVVEKEDFEKLKKRPVELPGNNTPSAYQPPIGGNNYPESFVQPNNNSNSTPNPNQSPKDSQWDLNLVVLDMSVGSGNEDIKEKIMRDHGHKGPNDFYSAIVENLHLFPK